MASRNPIKTRSRMEDKERILSLEGQVVNYHSTVMHSGHDPIPLRENQNRKGKWRQAKSTTTR